MSFKFLKTHVTVKLPTRKIQVLQTSDRRHVNGRHGARNSLFFVTSSIKLNLQFNRTEEFSRHWVLTAETARTLMFFNDIPLNFSRFKLFVVLSKIIRVQKKHCFRLIPVIKIYV